MQGPRYLLGFLLAACGLGLGKALLNPHLEMEAGAVEQLLDQ